MTALNLPTAYTWSTVQGLNNGFDWAPVWYTQLPSGLVAEVWENLEGEETLYSVQVHKPAPGFTPGSLYPDLDFSFDPVYLLFDRGVQLTAWLAALA